MKVLLDECVPKDLAKALSGHDVSTVQREGWASIGNGRLLALAELKFNAFITVDRGIRFQQPVTKYALLLVVLRARSNRPEDVLPFAPSVLDALVTAQPGQVRILDRP